MFRLFMLFALAILSISVLYSQVPVKRTDFTFTVSDGTKLDCTKFIPDSVAANLKWPVIIYIHGYGDSKYAELDNAKEQAEYGYYTLVYSVRGQGASTGLSNLISRTEMHDLFEIVDFVKKDTLADSTHFGIYGASQGGILPFMAVCNGLKVTMVMSDLASPEFASSWIENGSIKMTAFFSVDYDTSVARYTPEVINIRNWMLSKQENYWDSIAYYLPRNRDFISEVKYNKVPVLFSNAWQDKFFNTLGVIKATELLTVPFVAYWGAMDGHGADSTYHENNFISNLDNAWMEFYLNGIHHQLIDTSRFIYAESHYPVVSNMWSFSRYHSLTWPPQNVKDMTFYFHPEGTLASAPNTGTKDTLILVNDVIDSTLTMSEAIDSEFKGNAFTSKFMKRSLIFDSDILTTDYALAGTPKVNLNYMSDARVCQYNFQIWEVKPTNSSKFVTRINFTDRHCTQGVIHNTSIDGMSYAHLFKAGDRIRIIVTNLDTTPADSFLLSNPHVLPVLTKSNNTLLMNQAYPSNIVLPVEQIATGIDAENMLAYENKLFQNYPNPFNPATKITYVIPKPGFVELKVYDILGKEIAVLVHKEESSGSHTVEFNGRNLASGIYFYTIKTNGFRHTKKLMLIK